MHTPLKGGGSAPSGDSPGQHLLFSSRKLTRTSRGTHAAAGDPPEAVVASGATVAAVFEVAAGVGDVAAAGVGRSVAEGTAATVARGSARLEVQAASPRTTTSVTGHTRADRTRSPAGSLVAIIKMPRILERFSFVFGGRLDLRRCQRSDLMPLCPSRRRPSRAL